MEKGKRLKVLFFLTLALLGFTVYWEALSAPFVFDDGFYVTKNPWIKSLWNFTNPMPMRYVGDLSFALNYRVSGTSAASFHTVNVIIHIVNAFLVFSLGSLLFEAASLRVRAVDTGAGKFLFAALISTLFLVHPLNTQAVAYVSQRYTILAAFFYLSSVTLYLRWRLMAAAGGKGSGRALYLASIAAAVVAMKTKEVSFTLPFVIAVIEVSFFKEAGEKRMRLLRPFFITLLIIPVSLLVDTPSGNKAEAFMRLKKIGDIHAISSWSYLLTQSKVVLTYIRLLFFPADLHFNYYYPFSESILEPGVLASVATLSLAMISSICLLAVSLKKGWSPAVLAASGVLWFFITLSIESSVIPIRDAVNEHRVYLPGIGVFLSSAAALVFAWDLLRGRAWKTALAVSVLLAVAALSVATYRRNIVWGDEFLLYADDVRKNPLEPSPRINLGIAYANRGRLEESAAEFMKALEFDPVHPVARGNLAVVYLKLGRVDDAIKEYMVLAELGQNQFSPNLNLGVLYIKKGRLVDGEAELEKAVELDPGDGKARLLLQYLREGKADKIKID